MENETESRMSPLRAAISAQLPSSVLHAFGAPAHGVSVRPFAHAWGWSNTAIVACPGGDRFVLRRWRGAAAIARLVREGKLLDELCSRGFTELARREPTVSGTPCHIEADVGWSRYQWIRGEPLQTADASAAALAGRLLASLHNSGAAAGQPALGRLAGISPALDRAQPLLQRAGLADALATCVAEISAQRSRLEALPSAIVHGDFILDNIVVSEVGPHLVDFEFVRHDLRVFDLAPLIAPCRLPDGSFEAASPAFLRRAIARYAEALAVPLTADERELLPLIAVAHWLLVLADILEHDATSAEHVLPVLELACRASQGASTHWSARP